MGNRPLQVLAACIQLSQHELCLPDETMGQNLRSALFVVLGQVEALIADFQGDTMFGSSPMKVVEATKHREDF